MPGVGMKCLNTIQPIFGVDFHRTIPPPLPIPPYAPHIVVWGVGWSQKTGFLWAVANSKAASPESDCASPVRCGWGYGIGRMHDAGPHPAHIWPNLLLPLVLLGSGSKSEFASGTVVLPTGNFAVAVAYAVNLNLDCQDFPIPPLPTGVVVAALCTVHAGFTLGDFLGGLLSMLVDMAISWVAGLVVAGITSGLSAAVRGLAGGFRSMFLGGAGFLGAFGRGFGRGFVQNIASAFNVRMVSSLTPRALATAFAQAARTPVTRALLSSTPYIMGPIGSAISIYGVGSPLGYSSPSSVYGQAVTSSDPQHPDANDPNAWANRLGHRLAGESPESSSSYPERPAGTSS
ncbi:hypothetical protein WME94_50645 [Sorangium sp. So ce429]